MTIKRGGMAKCMCGDWGDKHCPFDHGLHQFYEGHYIEDTYTYVKDKDTDHCLKCGKKK